MCEDRAELEERLDRLEEIVEQQQATIDSFIEYRGDEEGLRTLFVDGYPIGRIADRAHQMATDAKKSIESVEEADRGGMNEQGRSAMLPAHRMWADIKEGQDDLLTKGQRRAGTIFGAFLHRACDTDPEEAPLPISSIDATGQSYSLTSTNAKELLRNADQVDLDGVYSATVKRVFEDVQRFTKQYDCQCESISQCNHGVIKFDDTRGTNILVANKNKLHEALKNVVKAVSSQPAEISDDSVSPETGPDEDPAVESNSHQQDDPSNIVVRRSGKTPLAADESHGG
jgi:hypothetical protein